MAERFSGGRIVSGRRSVSFERDSRGRLIARGRDASGQIVSGKDKKRDPRTGKLKVSPKSSKIQKLESALSGKLSGRQRRIFRRELAQLKRQEAESKVATVKKERAAASRKRIATLAKERQTEKRQQQSFSSQGISTLRGSPLVTPETPRGAVLGRGVRVGTIREQRREAGATTLETKSISVPVQLSQAPLQERQAQTQQPASLSSFQQPQRQPSQQLQSRRQSFVDLAKSGPTPSVSSFQAGSLISGAGPVRDINKAALPSALIVSQLPRTEEERQREALSKTGVVLEPGKVRPFARAEFERGELGGPTRTFTPSTARVTVGATGENILLSTTKPILSGKRRTGSADVTAAVDIASIPSFGSQSVPQDVKNVFLRGSIKRAASTESTIDEPFRGSRILTAPGRAYKKGIEFNERLFEKSLKFAREKGGRPGKVAARISEIAFEPLRQQSRENIITLTEKPSRVAVPVVLGAMTPPVFGALRTFKYGRAAVSAIDKLFVGGTVIGTGVALAKDPKNVFGTSQVIKTELASFGLGAAGGEFVSRTAIAGARRAKTSIKAKVLTFKRRGLPTVQGSRGVDRTRFDVFEQQLKGLAGVEFKTDTGFTFTRAKTKAFLGEPRPVKFPGTIAPEFSQIGIRTKQSITAGTSKDVLDAINIGTFESVGRGDSLSAGRIDTKPSIKFGFKGPQSAQVVRQGFGPVRSDLLIQAARGAGKKITLDTTKPPSPGRLVTTETSVGIIIGGRARPGPVKPQKISSSQLLLDRRFNAFDIARGGKPLTQAELSQISIVRGLGDVIPKPKSTELTPQRTFNAFDIAKRGKPLTQAELSQISIIGGRAERFGLSKGGRPKKIPEIGAEKPVTGVSKSGISQSIIITKPRSKGKITVTTEQTGGPTTVRGTRRAISEGPIGGSKSEIFIIESIRPKVGRTGKGKGPGGSLSGTRFKPGEGLKFGGGRFLGLTGGRGFKSPVATSTREVSITNTVRTPKITFKQSDIVIPKESEIVIPARDIVPKTKQSTITTNIFRGGNVFLPTPTVPKPTDFIFPRIPVFPPVGGGGGGRFSFGKRARRQTRFAPSLVAAETGIKLPKRSRRDIESTIFSGVEVRGLIR